MYIIAIINARNDFKFYCYIRLILYFLLSVYRLRKIIQSYVYSVISYERKVYLLTFYVNVCCTMFVFVLFLKDILFTTFCNTCNEIYVICSCK